MRLNRFAKTSQKYYGLTPLYPLPWSNFLSALDCAYKFLVRKSIVRALNSATFS
jgi:hypothetical protein